MIQQIYIGDTMEMLYSIEDACNLVRDNYSEELGELLLRAFDKLNAENDKAYKAYEEAYEEARAIRDECEEDAALAESRVTQIRENIENVIGFTLEYIEMSDEDRNVLKNALEEATEV